MENNPATDDPRNRAFIDRVRREETQKASKNEEGSSTAENERNSDVNMILGPSESRSFPLIEKSSVSQNGIPGSQAVSPDSLPSGGSLEQGSCSDADTWGIYALKEPSFARSPTSASSRTLTVGPIISTSSVPGQNVVIIRARTSSTPCSRDDEEIPEEEAVCKICFDVFKEADVLKTQCRCPNALVHEKCALDWSTQKGNNNCDVCGSEIQNLEVTLLRKPKSSLVGRHEHKKQGLFSRLKGN